MPRVSSAPEDAYHVSGKWIDGWGVVTDAKALVFQFPPLKEADKRDPVRRPAGHQDPPSLFCELTIQRYNDGDGARTPGEPETKMLGIARVNTSTLELDVHPGNYPNGDLDAEPEDMSGALGAEGNTVFALADGYQFNDKCGYMQFTQSLVEDGFKPQILKHTYFPDFVGLYAYFETVVLKGQKIQSTGDDVSAFRVRKGSTKIYPYEKGAAAVVDKAKGTAKGKAAAPAVSKAPAAAPSTSTAQAAVSNGEAAAVSSIEDIAIAIVKGVAAKKRGQTIPNSNKLKVEFLLGINNHKPPVPVSNKPALTKQMNDADWLLAIGMAHELFDLQEDGSIVFK